MTIIENNLKKYLELDQIDTFKTFLYNNHCYIAGSFVTEDNANDMDIYLKHDKVNKNHKIIELLESFGYKQDYHVNATYYTENILYIKTFTKKVHYKVLKIQIIACYDPVWVISNFDFTCCINCFNGIKIYYHHPKNYNNVCVEKLCFFNTNIKYTNLQLKTHEYRKKKYSNRGYTIKDKDINPNDIYNDINAKMLPDYQIVDIGIGKKEKYEIDVPSFTVFKKSRIIKKIIILIFAFIALGTCFYYKDIALLVEFLEQKFGN